MKKLHKSGIAIMAALAPAAAAGVTAGVLISMNKGSSGEDTEVKKDDFGKQYDKLFDTFKNSTLGYSKDDINEDVVLWSQPAKVKDAKYVKEKGYLTFIVECESTSNGDDELYCDILHWLNSGEGDVMKWSDIASYFADEGDAKFIIKADGGIEYSHSSGVIQAVKINKFGYVEYRKIQTGASNPKVEIFEHSIKFLREPSHVIE